MNLQRFLIFLLFVLTTLFVAAHYELHGGAAPDESSEHLRAKRDQTMTHHTIKSAEKQGESSSVLLFHIIYLAGILFITIISVLATWIILNQYFENEEPGCKQGGEEEDEEGEDLEDAPEDGTKDNDDEVDEDDEGSKDLEQKLPEMDEEINWVWGEEDEEVMRHYS